MPGAQRVMIGKLLIVSAVFLGTFAGAIWFGWGEIDPGLRRIVAPVMAAAAAADFFIAMRFLGEH